MRKLVWFGLLMYIAFLLLSHMPHFHKNDDQSKTQESDSENDPNQKVTMDMEMRKFYEREDILLESGYNKYEKLVKTLDNYLNRYISLFLITSNLVEHQVKDPNEMITVDLEITLRGDDLTYLQGFSKLGKESMYMKNLSKLDAIFSQIARLKKRSYMENAFKYSKSFLLDIIFRVLKNPVFNHYIPLIVIFTVIFIIYIFVFHKPLVTAVILLNSLIVWDSLNLYWKKIKEVDLEIYVKSMQFKEIPEDCDPSSMSWYQHVYSFFGQNRCLQYIQNMNKNPVEEVSILMCLIDTYSTYLLRVPIKTLGASIRDFTGEIGELWPWPFNFLLRVPLSLIFTVFIFFFILVFCGKRLKLSFLGLAVELGDVKSAIADKDKTGAATDALAINDVRNPRKLKPWTLVGLPKLSKDSDARRKSLPKIVESSAASSASSAASSASSAASSAVSSAALPDGVEKNESDSNDKISIGNQEDFSAPDTENSNVQPKEESLLGLMELF